MIDKFETNNLVLYFPWGYMMHIKPPVMCHISHVLCLVSHATFHPFPNHKSWWYAIFAWYSPYIMCHVSRVTFQVSYVTCDVSRVTCDMSHVMWLNLFSSFFFYKFLGGSWWKICYQRGLPLLVFWVFLIKPALILFFKKLSWLIVVCFGSLKKHIDENLILETLARSAKNGKFPHVRMRPLVHIFKS